MPLIFFQKILRYYNFCPGFVNHVEKQLHKKAKLNFEICDVKICGTNKCNTHIVQYIKK